MLIFKPNTITGIKKTIVSHLSLKTNNNQTNHNTPTNNNSNQILTNSLILNNSSPLLNSNSPILNSNSRINSLHVYHSFGEVIIVHNITSISQMTAISIDSTLSNNVNKLVSIMIKPCMKSTIKTKHNYSYNSKWNMEKKSYKIKKLC